MLRVLIEVEQPAGGRRKLVLRSGQQLDFGSSEYAHVALRDDAALSATHFRIQADRDACYLQDLDSSHGTFVNDKAVEMVVLRDGDWIAAGQSKFRVSIQGGAAGDAVVPPPAVRDTSGKRLPHDGSRPATYVVETCSSGLTVCRGEGAEVSSAALAAQLQQVFPLYLLVDVHKFEPPQALPTQTGELLIDWLGDEVAAGMSPRFVAAADFPDWPQVVEAGWGADAVVCVFSAEEPSQLLSALRRRARADGNGRSRGIVGICWPSILEPMLRSSPPDATGGLMTGIDAVLVESPDDPESWSVFGSRDLGVKLKQLGLEGQERSEDCLQGSRIKTP